MQKLNKVGVHFSHYTPAVNQGKWASVDKFKDPQKPCNLREFYEICAELRRRSGGLLVAVISSNGWPGAVVDKLTFLQMAYLRDCSPRLDKNFRKLFRSHFNLNARQKVLFRKTLSNGASPGKPGTQVKFSDILSDIISDIANSGSLSRYFISDILSDIH